MHVSPLYAENLPHWHPKYQEFGVRGSGFGVESSEQVPDEVREETPSAQILRETEIQLEISLEIPIPEAKTDPTNSTKDEQPESRPEASDSDYTTPPQVVQKTEPAENQPEAAPSKEHSESGRPPKSAPTENQAQAAPGGQHSDLHQTPPIMKGNASSFSPASEAGLGGSHCAGEGKILELEEEAQKKAQQEFYFQLQQAPEILFTGKTFASTVSLENIPRRQVRCLANNTLVELIPEPFHSHHPKLIYVKPKPGGEDWLDGIAVPIRFLKPITSLDAEHPP